jgi:phosphopantothenoylcysteine decarboxylase/phosphopantothenate--cysteine ligase
MRIIVTAGPTREYIDSVRFITNASSGQMGCAVAAAAARAGHEVTLLLGGGKMGTGSAGCLAVPVPFLPAGEKDKMGTVPNSNSGTVPIWPFSVVPFVSVQDLKAALEQRFDQCDALVMAAAVGDFRPEKILPYKLSRRGGPITLKLYPTEDILAGLGQRKRAGQIIVAFAVEDAPAEQVEAKARAEMIEKNADFVVVNTPAAMAAHHSHACILSREAVVLPWADRPKQALAEHIVALLK